MNQSERKLYVFSKAGWWESLTPKQQEQYLKDHPRSKMKITEKDAKKPSDYNWAPSDLMFIGEGKFNKESYKTKKNELRDIAANNDSYLYDDTVKLNHAEILSVADYTGSGFSNVNKYLRGELPFLVDDKELQDKVDSLNAIIKKQPGLSKELTLFRGLSVSKGDIYKEGKTYTNPSFLSVSASPMVAANFTSEKSEDKEPVMLQIKVNKGHKLLYIPNIERQRKAKGIHIPVYEKEAIFNSRSTFKVLKVEKVDSGTVVYAEILNESD